MSKANLFPKPMRAFFYEWLVEQRNASTTDAQVLREVVKRPGLACPWDTGNY